MFDHDTKDLVESDINQETELVTLLNKYGFSPSGKVPKYSYNCGVDLVLNLTSSGKLPIHFSYSCTCKLKDFGSPPSYIAKCHVGTRTFVGIPHNKKAFSMLSATKTAIHKINRIFKYWAKIEHVQYLTTATVEIYSLPTPTPDRILDRRPYRKLAYFVENLLLQADIFYEVTTHNDSCNEIQQKQYTALCYVVNRCFIGRSTPCSASAELSAARRALLCLTNDSNFVGNLSSHRRLVHYLKRSCSTEQLVVKYNFCTPGIHFLRESKSHMSYKAICTIHESDFEGEISFTPSRALVTAGMAALRRIRGKCFGLG